jgi:hypothetical protein
LKFSSGHFSKFLGNRGHFEPFKIFQSKKLNELKKTVAFSVKNCAAEAALALKSTGTGLGTENATATIYHPARFLEMIPSGLDCSRFTMTKFSVLRIFIEDSKD